MSDIYNSDIKQMYLDQFGNKETVEVYTRLFRKSLERESNLNKDLYDFNDEEMEDFLKKILKPKTKESARTYCNVLSNYIQWAIDNPKISNTINLFNPLKRRQEYFYEFVQESRTYFSIDEKHAITSSLDNKQDSFIIDALWEGIQGSKLSELVNLRIEDMNHKDGIITLRDDEGNITRTIEMDRVWMDSETNVFENAILANREQMYYKMNGTVDYSEKVRDHVLLPLRSEYVLKSAQTNSKNNIIGGEKVSHYTVYNRLEMVKKLKEFEEYADALTTKNIVRSGMIYKALKIYQRDHKLDRPQIEEICERYDMKYKWSLRDFLNVDMLEKLYPDEVAEVKNQSVKG